MKRPKQMTRGFKQCYKKVDWVVREWGVRCELQLRESAGQTNPPFNALFAWEGVVLNAKLKIPRMLDSAVIVVPCWRVRHLPSRSCRTESNLDHARQYRGSSPHEGERKTVTACSRISKAQLS